MYNRGFTLVELTAIIVILAIIFLISFPNLLNISKNDEKKLNESMKNDLCKAGETYIYSNLNDFDILEEGKKIQIPIEDLIKNNLVDKNKKNPKTKNNVGQDELIYTVLTDGTLECEYVEFKKEG